MEFGLGIPTRGPLADPASIEAIATRAETLGFSWLAVSDHLIVPRAIDSRYPYSDSGAFPGAATGECLEQFTLLAFLAAITTRPRLLTSVTVVPHRGAIETAKLVSTIDNLSSGRLTFGVGAGWMEEEFKALQTPPFAARGKVTDEVIEACRVLWKEDAPAYDGEHHLLTGEASAIVDDIGTLAGIGVEQVLLNFQRAGLERSLESMQRFADEVMTKT